MGQHFSEQPASASRNILDTVRVAALKVGMSSSETPSLLNEMGLVADHVA